MTPTITFTQRHVHLARDEMEQITRKAKALGLCGQKGESCSIVIELPHRHHRQGRRYKVRASLSDRPGATMDSGRDLVVTEEHEVLLVAVSRALRVLKRQVQHEKHADRSHWSHPPRKLREANLREAWGGATA